MQTTPKRPPETDILPKTQNIRKLLSERGYRVSAEMCNQDGGEAAARIQSPLDSFFGVETQPLKQIT